MSRAKMFMAAITGVLALIGLSSSMASAVTAGWMVNGTMLTGTAALANTAAVDEASVLTAGAVRIECTGTTLKVTNSAINAATQMDDASSLTFSSCAGNSVCPLGERQGTTISTLPVLMDLTLQGSLGIQGRFLATNSSKVLATIEFGGAECSFAGVEVLRGSQGFLVPTGQNERTLQLLTAETLVQGELKSGSTSWVLKGSILMRLTSGLPFSFL